MWKSVKENYSYLLVDLVEDQEEEEVLEGLLISRLKVERFIHVKNEDLINVCTFLYKFNKFDLREIMMKFSKR